MGDVDLASLATFSLVIVMCADQAGSKCLIGDYGEHNISPCIIEGRGAAVGAASIIASKSKVGYMTGSEQEFMGA